MKRPTFLHGVGLALLFAFVGAAVFAALAPFIAPGFVLRVIVAGLGLAYVIYLLGASRQHVGRIAAFVLWLTVAAITWYMALPLPLYLLTHAGLIWLVRTLYFHNSSVPALMDAGLSSLALAAAVWAATSTGSVFIALWCFFLVQALFVAIPARIKGPQTVTERDTADDRFERSHRMAEAALRRLSMRA